MSITELKKFCERSCAEYEKIFGYYPEVTNYFCTPEEYINGLHRALEEKKELGNFIKQLRPNK